MTPDFELTTGQKQAMDMMARVFKSRAPLVAILTGYAGTGKTTLIKTIASVYGPPLILTPTGKAALRVQEATGITASTIHRWMYHAVENQNSGEMEFKRKPSDLVERPTNGLVVVDEASMVGRDLWEDLWDVCLLLDLKLLMVGDTFQLAPIEAPNKEAFVVLKDVETDFRVALTEVTRQALDNPVLRASMLLREQSLPHQALSLLPRVFNGSFDDKCLETYQKGGAIIVHKNDTRHRINAMLRERLGHGPEIVVGEPLLVLRNTYEIQRYNGEIVQYGGWQAEPERVLKVDDRFKHITLDLRFGVALIDGQRVMLCPEQVRGEASLMTENVIGRQSRREYLDRYTTEEDDAARRNGERVEAPPHLHSNFGYALTCHKSQGSEWNQVLVLVEPSTRYTTYEGRRWLYTAITRAREKAYVCLGAPT